MRAISLAAMLLASLSNIDGVSAAYQQIDEKVSFQAVDHAGAIVWASGTQGGIYRSNDAGVSWQKVTGPDNTQTLQFRDVEVVSEKSVYLMSAGEGSDSRIYRTTNGGTSWQLLLQADNPHHFFDCLSVNEAGEGYLYGDSDSEGLFVLHTQNGTDWQRTPLPIDAQASEGGFASSGTCLQQTADNTVLIGTGNGVEPRVILKSANQPWTTVDSPFAGGEAAGIFSVQKTNDVILAFGGSLKTPDSPAIAYQYYDGNWHELPNVPLKGAIYGSAIHQDDHAVSIWVSNPEGVAVWREGTNLWEKVSDQNIWSMTCLDNGTCIGVGKNGGIERF